MGKLVNSLIAFYYFIFWGFVLRDWRNGLLVVLDTLNW